MATDGLRFTEIEHKFVVGDDFDLGRFAATLDALGPSHVTALPVEDRYFLTEDGVRRRFVVRHRFDRDLHHLTVKTLDPDAEVRVEVNLDLGHHAGDQRAQVDAFVRQFGVRWEGGIHKDIRVWHFADVEVVYYAATNGPRSVRCVEFEATEKPSLAHALEALSRYERLTGFDARERTPLSLLQILCPEIEALLGGSVA